MKRLITIGLAIAALMTGSAAAQVADVTTLPGPTAGAAVTTSTGRQAKAPAQATFCSANGGTTWVPCAGSGGGSSGATGPGAADTASRVTYASDGSPVPTGSTTIGNLPAAQAIGTRQPFAQDQFTKQSVNIGGYGNGASGQANTIVYPYGHNSTQMPAIGVAPFLRNSSNMLDQMPGDVRGLYAQGDVASGTAASASNPFKMGGVDPGGVIRAQLMTTGGAAAVSLATSNGNLALASATTEQSLTGNNGAAGSLGVLPRLYTGTGNNTVLTPGDANGAFTQGNVASGAADSGNPVKVGARYNSTLPSFTSGQRADLQVGLYGRLLTAAGSQATWGAVPTSLAVMSSADSFATGSGGFLIVGSNYLDTATNQSRPSLGDADGARNVIVPASTAAGLAASGIAPGTVANVTSQVAKAAPGNLFGLNVDNAAVTGTYAIVYNANAAPAAGATLTAASILWHFGLTSSGSLDKTWTTPVYCNVGCTVLYSTSLTTYTAPATAPLASTVMVK